MENLPSNISNLIVLLILLSVCFHIVLIKFIKLNQMGWKYLEYVWIFFAFLSLIAASSQSRIWIASIKMDTAYEKAQSQFDILRKWLGSTEPVSYICMKFIKTPLSPDNFDEIQSEHDQLCAWNKKILADLPKSISNDLPEIDYEKLKPPILPKNKILIEFLQTVRMYSTDYQKTRNKYLDHKKAAKKTFIEEIFSFFTPIFLCIALALRVTKITAEINFLRMNSLNRNKND